MGVGMGMYGCAHTLPNDRFNNCCIVFLVGVIYYFSNKCTIFSSRGVVFYFIFHELSFLLEVDQEVKNYCFQLSIIALSTLYDVCKLNCYLSLFANVHPNALSRKSVNPFCHLSPYPCASNYYTHVPNNQPVATLIQGVQLLPTGNIENIEPSSVKIMDVFSDGAMEGCCHTLAQSSATCGGTLVLRGWCNIVRRGAQRLALTFSLSSRHLWSIDTSTFSWALRHLWSIDTFQHLVMQNFQCNSDNLPHQNNPEPMQQKLNIASEFNTINLLQQYFLIAPIF